MVSIKIQKSPIPIIWLDTSIILKITMYKTNPMQLEETERNRVGSLYKLVKSASEKGNIICPLAQQEMEVWIDRDAWTDTIHELGLGIECASEQTIQMNQMRAAISSYLSGSSEINLSYLDAFLDDPVKKLKAALLEPFIVTVRRDIIFGADYHRKKKPETLALLNQAREKNIANKVSLQQQLEVERLAELELLLSQSATIMHAYGDQPEDTNAFWGYIQLGRMVREWMDLGGQPPDLSGYIEFYKSEHNSKCPYNQLRTVLYSKIMIDPQPIKRGDPFDIQHISTLMPYSDLFITDKSWSTFLNRNKSLDKYGTKICYIGDTKDISEFFDSLI